MTAHEKAVDWKTVLIGEALVLKLLARLLLDEPETALLQSLIEENVFAEIPFGGDQDETRLGQGLLEKWRNDIRPMLREERLQEIKVDYTRLFIGTDHVLAAPWESVYLSKERMLFQEHTLQVRGWYRRFGIEAEKLYQEPDDHIGLEISFLAHLAVLGLTFLEASDQPAFQKTLQAQRDFLSQHTLNWAPAWADLVDKYAKTDFYRGLASLTIGALRSLANLLDIKVPDQRAK